MYQSKPGDDHKCRISENIVWSPDTGGVGGGLVGGRSHAMMGSICLYYR